MFSRIGWQAIFEENWSHIQWNPCCPVMGWTYIGLFCSSLNKQFLHPASLPTFVTWKISTAFTCFHYVCINDFVRWLREKWYSTAMAWHGMTSWPWGWITIWSLNPASDLHANHASLQLHFPISLNQSHVFRQNGDISWHFNRRPMQGYTLFHAKIDCTLGSKPLLHLPLERPEKPPGTKQETTESQVSSHIYMD